MIAFARGRRSCLYPSIRRKNRGRQGVVRGRRDCLSAQIARGLASQGTAANGTRGFGRGWCIAVAMGRIDGGAADRGGGGEVAGEAEESQDPSGEARHQGRTARRARRRNGGRLRRRAGGARGPPSWDANGESACGRDLLRRREPPSPRKARDSRQANQQ